MVLKIEKDGVGLELWEENISMFFCMGVENWLLNNHFDNVSTQ